jgi:6-phosphogluconate dehydrogenase
VADPNTASSSNGSAIADIGLVGLAVMGQNLVLNIADNGYTVAVFNRTTQVMTDWIAKCRKEEPSAHRLVGCETLEKFVKSIKRPRKIIILVKAGAPVDAVVDSLLPYLEKDDIVIDGGNSLWTDTIRREKTLKEKGLCFFGSGVSGGETGARFGPSLMPGGDPAAWKSLKPIWEAISAKVDPKTGKPNENFAPGRPAKGGVPCTTYIGTDGAGHYVKMVHNGIEYGDMQLICEAYYLMKHLLGMKPDEMSAVFTEWNKGDLDSFLIQITADILQQKDPSDPKGKKFLVDMVLDTAGQKGTGKWTSVNALDMGVPAPSIAEAVFARCMSAKKENRVEASKKLKGPKYRFKGKKKALITAIRDALYCSKLCSYAQGFDLMNEAQKEFKWKLNFGEIAMIWRGGCIIRAGFLQKIKEAYDNNPNLANLILDPYFKKKIDKAQKAWRQVVALSAEAGVACPQFMSALSYYDSFRSAVLPANLLQAQRDYFGAHTFERVDQPRGKTFHVDWPEKTRPILEMKSAGH